MSGKNVNNPENVNIKKRDIWKMRPHLQNNDNNNDNDNNVHNYRNNHKN